MAQVTITNNTAGDFILPAPFSYTLHRGTTKTFNGISLDAMSVNWWGNGATSLAAALLKGSISVTVADDPTVPNAIEPQNRQMNAGASADYVAGGKTVNNKGIIPSARLKIATNPTNLDTVTIGTSVFQFVTSLGAAGSNTQIKIGASAAATRAVLIEAINGTVDAANWTAATSPNTLALLADDVNATDANYIRVRVASTQGGAAVAAAKSSVALSSSLTAGADGWDRANLNVTGKAESANAMSMGDVTITSAMVTAGKVYIELPFTPVSYVVTALTSTGALRAFTDTVVIEGTAIKITLAGGASPNLQTGDVVTVWASA